MAYGRSRSYSRRAPSRAPARRSYGRRRTAGRGRVSRRGSSGVRDIRIVIEQPGASAARPPLGMVQAAPQAPLKAKF